MHKAQQQHFLNRNVSYRPPLEVNEFTNTENVKAPAGKIATLKKTEKVHKRQIKELSGNMNVGVDKLAD